LLLFGVLSDLNYGHRDKVVRFQSDGAMTNEKRPQLEAADLPGLQSVTQK
jgi:hypothetical protein